MVKLKIYSLIVIFFVTTILSCKKDNYNSELTKNENLVANELLEMKNTDTESGKVLNSFLLLNQKSEINPSKSEIEIIELTSNYKTNIIGANFSIKFFVGKLNNENHIIDGNVFEVVSESKFHSNEAIKLIKSNFNGEKTNFTGTLIKLNLKNEYQFELNYKEGKLFSKKKIELNNSNDLARGDCVYYFLVEYDTETGEILSAVFLYQICSGIQGCELTRNFASTERPVSSRCGGGGGGNGEIEYVDAQGYRKPFSVNNFRHNLGIRTNQTPPTGYDAHHIFPQKFVANFIAVGIDKNDPDYGVFWELHDHRSDATDYNLAWEVYFRDHPNATKSQVLAQGRVIMANFGFPSLNY